MHHWKSYTIKWQTLLRFFWGMPCAVYPTPAPLRLQYSAPCLVSDNIQLFHDCTERSGLEDFFSTSFKVRNTCSTVAKDSGTEYAID